MEFPNFIIGHASSNGPCSIAMLVFGGVLKIVGPQLAMIWFGDSLSKDKLFRYIPRGYLPNGSLGYLCHYFGSNAHI